VRALLLRNTVLTRSPRAREEAEGRLKADHRLANQLQNHGHSPFRSDAEVIRLDIETCGKLHSTPARELRNWSVFSTVAKREGAKASAEMISFLQSQLAEDRGRKHLITIRLRLRYDRNRVPTGNIAERHKAYMALTGPMFSYASTRFPGVLEPLSHGVHHRMLGDGSTIDLHSHATLCMENSSAGKHALAWFHRYFSKHFDVHQGYKAVPATSYTEAGAISAYEEQSFSAKRSNDGTYVEPFWISKYINLAHIENHLHRRVTMNSLRKHIGELRRDGVRPLLTTTVIPEFALTDSTDPINVIVNYVDVRSYRLRRRPGSSPSTHGLKLLCARLSWIGDELRPVLLVRQCRTRYGPSELWQKCTELYDLNYLIEQARESFTRNLTK